MKVTVRCNSCHAERELVDVDALNALDCPGCGAVVEKRASEDFASALEDALAQLWWLRQNVQLQVELSTDSIPEDFVPALDESEAS